MTKEWLRLYHAVRIALMNADPIPDPKMTYMTDTYSVPLDDIEALESAFRAINMAEINTLEDIYPYD